jgi:hypothetical protein
MVHKIIGLRRILDSSGSEQGQMMGLVNTVMNLRIPYQCKHFVAG